MNRIRPIAICLFRRDGKILVFRGYDPAKDATFFRPLGGGIEFGEHSTDTIRREIREEIGAEVEKLVYLGTLENIFTYNNTPGHEIVQVYDGVLTDTSLYEQAVLPGHEDSGKTIDILWKHLDEFGPGKATLHPDGLLAIATR